MKKLRVAVLMGGASTEHEVSMWSGTEVIKNLDPKKYSVLPIILDKNGKTFAMGNKEKKKEPINNLPLILKDINVAFIALHGSAGEDGKIQGLLEFMKIPHTGSGVLASSLGMDKIISRKLFQSAELKVPKYITVDTLKQAQEASIKLGFPSVLKPIAEGSSVGVSIIKNKKDVAPAFKKAVQYGRVFVEEFVSGMEVTCGVMGNNSPIALPVIEIIPKNEFFDYEAKYTKGKSEEICPARITEKETRIIQEAAIKAHTAIGASGATRVDMFLKNNEATVLEINTIPGFTENSLIPKAAKVFGLTFSEFLDKMIEQAIK